MFCNIFHIEIGNEEVKTLQFRDCNGCSKRQIIEIKVKRSKWGK